MKHTLLAKFKHYLFVCLMACAALPAKAQYVTIPDAGLVAALDSLGFSACFTNGNQLDTTCSQVLKATLIDLSTFSYTMPDLTVIQYFKSLDTLVIASEAEVSLLPAFPPHLTYLSIPDCDFLDSFPPLPNSLTYLYISFCTNTNFPALPDSLQTLYCSSNNLTSISLPSHLLTLDCTYNKLTSFSSLPASLRSLTCDQNKLDSLPELPAQLQVLSCNYNNLLALPALPAQLFELKCENNFITALPILPAGLNDLYCAQNSLAALPVLPVSLWNLEFGDSLLVSLPVLPASLVTLNIYYTLLHSLSFTSWPVNLYFDCSYNPLLDSLPLITTPVSVISCGHDNLTTIGNTFPNTKSFFCSYNRLSTLPDLPSGLTDLRCDNNQMTSIPPLPPNLSFQCQNNPSLFCLPAYTTLSFLNFENTAVSCVQSYNGVAYSEPALNTLPLCNANNINGCTSRWNITGQAFQDNNNNCTYDAGEGTFQNVKLKLWQSDTLLAQAFSIGGGNYSFDVPAKGKYAITVDTTNLPFNVICPVNDVLNDTISATDSVQWRQDFSLACKPGLDLGVWSIAAMEFMPGIDGWVHISAGDIANFFGAHCANGISGTVNVVLSGPADFISASSNAAVPVINGDVLSWSVVDFGAISGDTDFNFEVHTLYSATSNDQVCFQVSVVSAAADSNLSNNNLSQCYPVLASWDPNLKEVTPATHVDVSDPWLTYTIHFQNTGTAPAANIHVDDTIDIAHLDISTLQLLSYSQAPQVQIRSKGVVRFNFPGINLPDSTVSFEASQGYVQYKIKLINNLAVNTQISNKASIYFDYNSAVVTNTVTSIVTNGPCVPSDSGLAQSICQGDTFYIGYKAYFIAGTYADTLQNASGCDSIVALTLTVNPLPAVTLSWDSMLILNRFQVPLPGDTGLCGYDHPFFLLSGGMPAGGTYSGLNVVNDSLFLVSSMEWDTIMYTFIDSNGCSGSATDRAYLDDCESIQSINADNAISLYPNPASNLLYIKTDGLHAENILIYDVDGQVVAKQAFTPEIDIHNLTAGVYLLEITSKEGVARKRWVKM